LIVITGQGRSGTSLIAKLYKELGFDPGGVWFDETRSGLEDEDIVTANGYILWDLGVSVDTDRFSGDRIERRNLQGALTPVGRARAYVGSWLDVVVRALLDRGDDLTLVPWSRMDAVAARYTSSLRGLAESHAVAKDPRFCWTLAAWAKSGAAIDHVLVCVRNVDAMVRSRMLAQQVVFRTESAAKNSYVYAMGLLMTAIHDFRLPYSVIQFPDFLDDPDALYDVLRFPAPVDRERFRDAWTRVVDRSLVHDTR